MLCVKEVATDRVAEQGLLSLYASSAASSDYVLICPASANSKSVMSLVRDLWPKAGYNSLCRIKGYSSISSCFDIICSICSSALDLQQSCTIVQITPHLQAMRAAFF
jgi:hypothetical protein